MAKDPKKRTYHAAVHEARRAVDAVPLEYVDPADALQWMVARTSALAKHAAERVDGLDEDALTFRIYAADPHTGSLKPTGVADHEYVRLEDRLFSRLSSLCVNVERIGLGERMVRIEEAKMMLVVRALQAALRDVGVEPAKVKAIGPAFRSQLENLQAERQAA